jgi:hypothetical protein
MAEIFEMIMVLSFGLSWPISISKTLKSKTAAGKSPVFIGLIVFGYICGIISKIVSQNITYVFVFYCINLVMTSFDLCLNLYYRHKESLN